MVMQDLAPDGLGGEQNDNAGDTAEDAQEVSEYTQLPGLPPMIGQDGKPLIVPIKRATFDDGGMG